MAIRRRGRRLAPRLILAAAVTLLGAALLPESAPRQRTAIASSPAPETAEAGLSVLTYNVKGLPWPVAMGREQALGDIADRLRTLRREARHPRVVLLQEAFTGAAKRIGRESGYRYVAEGPVREAVPAATRPDFVAEGNPLLGEGIGKFADSGLMILSDYPILAVRRAAFPDDACAGFDCLASKGMVMALIAVPGAATPVAVINAHLNARRASGVSIARAFEAYERQVGALDRFVEAAVPAGIPVIVAGDLNVGQSPDRRALMEATVADWLDRPRTGDVKGELRRCFEARRCGPLPADAAEALDRNKDWQVAVPSGRSRLISHRIEVPFGRKAGTMFSDHVGYTVHYRFGGLQRAALAR